MVCWSGSTSEPRHIVNMRDPVRVPRPTHGDGAPVLQKLQNHSWNHGAFLKGARLLQSEPNQMLESLDESDLSPGSRLFLPSPSEHLASVSVCRFLRLGSFYPVTGSRPSPR